MKNITLILLLVLTVVLSTGCQPYTDPSVKQLISEMKEDLEKSKNVAPVYKTNSTEEINSIILAMNKAFEESVDAILSKTSTTSPLTDAKINELNREVIRLSLEVEKHEVDKTKRIALEGEIEKFEERIGKIENAQLRVENEILTKHFDAQNEILKKLTEMVANISQTAPAEVTKQLQAQYAELQNKIKVLEDEKVKSEKDLKDALDEVAKKDRRYKSLQKEKEVLEEALKKEKGDSTTEPNDKDEVKIPEKSNIPGVITGKIIQFSRTDRNFDAIVAFPKGTKLAKDNLLNVFNNKGEKVGRFKVTWLIEKSSIPGMDKFGGSITLLEANSIIEKNYRVTTLTKMPDITKTEK
ncbi:MAG: hypothetical protein K8S87_10125 [Planctomycetes bacterium]|nr:hypothetical protein [Planctomycetota bacterium]